MKICCKIFQTVLVSLIVILIFSMGTYTEATIFPYIKVAGPGSDFGHTPLFPHIKVAVLDYRASNTPEELEFMASHYDLLIGGTLEGYGDSPGFSYTNYYCTYVGSPEYNDMQAWATSHGVDFEDFFIHFAEPTRACLPDSTTGKTECYDLSAGSRVPTNDWQGTGGDLTSYRARIASNPGNANYRAWKLDWLEKEMGDRYDGVFVDNTSFSSIPAFPTIESGGTIAEYPTDAGTSFGNDVLKLFAEFKARFGNSKVQVPNVSSLPDDTRVYPYVWGIFREHLLRPSQTVWFPTIDKNIADSTAAGVANVLHSGANDERSAMATLALFYLVKNETTYLAPYNNWGKPELTTWTIDPRLNQWWEAIAYNVGQPKGDRYTFARGIDPASPLKDSMTATVTKIGWSYRLTDPSKNWPENQWQNLKIRFPSGFLTNVYKSGSNWVELFSPGEVPTDGTYQLGTYAYEVLAREFDNALVLFRPLGASGDASDASAVEVALPATADNLSGTYYLLDWDENLDPTPRTTLSMRNTDGAVLIKTDVLNDTEPPTTPANLSATAVSSTQIDLFWDASTDNIRVLGYKIYRDGNQVGISRTTTYSDTGLLLGKTYTYYVIAYDFPGNESEKSNSVSITLTHTPFASDLTQVKAYPNPFRGDKHNQIIFSNLTANVNIKIYTLTGDLVKEIKEQVGDKAYWDVKNKQGEAVSSGIYIYYITNPKGQEKKGKLAIIK